MRAATRGREGRTGAVRATRGSARVARFELAFWQMAWQGSDWPS